MKHYRVSLFVALVASLWAGGIACSDDDGGGDLCGNGVAEGAESCDGSDLLGQSCTSIAGDFTGGTLACTSGCALDTSGCTSGPAECGNGTRETGEACDGDDFGADDCTTVGNYVGGTLGCTASCELDLSACELDPNCGNGALDANEECDGAELGGASCVTVPGGFTGGVLDCAVDCTYDVSGCTTGADPSQQIADARATADGSNLSLPIDGAWVTYIKGAVGTDPAGFFLQADPLGPALFVAVDPATLTPQPAVGDAVSLVVTTMTTRDWMRVAGAITSFAVLSSGHDPTILSQEVSAATDLVSALDDREVELIQVTGTVAGTFHFAGAGHQSARFETAAITGDTLLQLRVPDALLPVVGLEQGCEVQVSHTPLWRFEDRAQISIWATADASLISCPAPVVLGAMAVDATTVLVTINRAVDPASVQADGSQLTFTHGLAASAATVAGNEITVTTAAQTPGETYTVTVAQTVTDVLGVGLAPPPDNQADFTGYVVNLCGNGTVDAGEECDDGNQASYDGCSSSCRNDAGHLLISEVVVTPTEAEFVEIYNPTASAVSLDGVYLADFDTYYLITQGNVTAQGSDFVATFPAGGSIPAGGFVVVAIGSATLFHGVYGSYPDYDLDAGDANAPAMTGTIGANAGLTNASEMVVLFTWDGSSDLVQDLDYVLYGTNTAVAMDKSGVAVGTSSYLAETAEGSQSPASSPNTGGQSLERCDTSEGAETATGSNGVLGHDETSEIMGTTFGVSSSPTPGSPPAAATCGP